MDSINIHAAKTNLSKLVDKASQGQSIIIAKAGKPMAKLVPYVESEKAENKPRQWGQWTGQIWYAPDYDQADALIEKMFEESEIFPKD